MNRITEYVNVFQGNGKVDLPKPEGIASRWLFLKAQVGNTHPHAAYPFGKITAGAYTGGYPTGYGNLCPSSHGECPTFNATVRGFSHEKTKRIARRAFAETILFFCADAPRCVMPQCMGALIPRCVLLRRGGLCRECTCIPLRIWANDG